MIKMISIIFVVLLLSVFIIANSNSTASAADNNDDVRKTWPMATSTFRNLFGEDYSVIQCSGFQDDWAFSALLIAWKNDGKGKADLKVMGRQKRTNRYALIEMNSKDSRFDEVLRLLNKINDFVNENVSSGSEVDSKVIHKELSEFLFVVEFCSPEGFRQIVSNDNAEKNNTKLKSIMAGLKWWNRLYSDDINVVDKSEKHYFGKMLFVKLPVKE